MKPSEPSPTIAEPSPSRSEGLVPGNAESVEWCEQHRVIPEPSPSNEVTQPFRALSIIRALSNIVALCDRYTVHESTLEAVVPAAEIRHIIKAALRAPTIAAPSTSNEVTAEIVEAFWEGCGFIYQDDAPSDEQVKAGIEAALKARKPADDGAGQ